LRTTMPAVSLLALNEFLDFIHALTVNTFVTVFVSYQGRGHAVMRYVTRSHALLLLAVWVCTW